MNLTLAALIFGAIVAFGAYVALLVGTVMMAYLEQRHDRD